MLWAPSMLRVVRWAGGFFIIQIRGAVICVLLIIAVIVLIYHLVTGGITI